MQKILDEPNKEQYETLIALLEEQNDIQEKTIGVLEQQVNVLQEMLASAEARRICR